MADRFWEKVDHDGSCWRWQGARQAWGYGAFYFGGRRASAHRVAWLLVAGPAAPNAKLTPADVVAIREQYVRGCNRWRPGNSGALGGRFGIDRSTIRRIVHRQDWAHV